MKIISLKTNNKTNFLTNQKDSIYNNGKASDTILSPSNKEWNNTVYSFNKKIKHLPVSNNLTNLLIERYLNIYDIEREKGIKSFIKDKRRRKNLGSKIWISKAELKYTNDKVIINIFVYNRKINFLLKRLNKNINYFYKKKINSITNKLRIDTKSWSKNIFNHIIMYYKNKISMFEKKLERKDIKSIFIKNLIQNQLNKYFYKNIYLTLIKKVLKKELFVLLYKQNILFNTLKYKNIFMTPLIKILKKIHNKQVVFNIICLKNYFLNSDIFTQIIANKAEERKNRIAKILRVSLLKTNVPTIKKRLIKREKKFLNQFKNLTIKNNINSSLINDELDTLIKKININNTNPNSQILNIINNKTITGVRLEASGRLTKRFTAQRSVFKIRYKGTLKNVDSSYRGLPSKLVRNYNKSNIQYTFSNSNNRIGAFGIKGWIGSR